MPMLPRERIAHAVNQPATHPALVAFATAGYPDANTFLSTLRRIADNADVVELGIPFTDPMADGVTIQRSSEGALAQGVSLRWIFEQLEQRDFELSAPLLFMSYLNPLLTFGYQALAERAAKVGVDGFIVPDLPYEESGPLREALDPHGLALVQLVTPATPAQRLEQLCAASRGFVYAVTVTGITGGAQSLPTELSAYFERVRAAAGNVPVCAGFGIRNHDDVARIGANVDGVIVGSALVEVLEQGKDPGTFLQQLRSPA
ncbi:MAG: tryptophan synthase subunit alpha [Gammaproteobacteria bacterium]